jgi:hypothetical protein
LLEEAPALSAGDPATDGADILLIFIERGPPNACKTVPAVIQRFPVLGTMLWVIS